MNAKTTTVLLVAGDMQRGFEFSHAERLLRMRNNGGWKLPADSPFEFVENVLRNRDFKKGTSGKKTGGTTGKGKTASVKD